MHTYRKPHNSQVYDLMTFPMRHIYVTTPRWGQGISSLELPPPFTSPKGNHHPNPITTFSFSCSRTFFKSVLLRLLSFAQYHVYASNLLTFFWIKLVKLWFRRLGRRWKSGIRRSQVLYLDFPRDRITTYCLLTFHPLCVKREGRREETGAWLQSGEFLVGAECWLRLGAWLLGGCWRRGRGRAEASCQCLRHRCLTRKCWLFGSCHGGPRRQRRPRHIAGNRATEVSVWLGPAGSGAPGLGGAAAVPQTALWLSASMTRPRLCCPRGLSLPPTHKRPEVLDSRLDPRVTRTSHGPRTLILRWEDRESFSFLGVHSLVQQIYI